MERCSIYTIRFRTRDNGKTLENVTGVSVATVHLENLRNFDQPIVKKFKWSCRLSELIVNITYTNIWEILKSKEIWKYDSAGFQWTNFLAEFMPVWVLKNKERAGRIHIVYSYADSGRIPYEQNYTLEFIEFGDVVNAPQSIVTLTNNLKRHGSNPMTIDSDPTDLTDSFSALAVQSDRRKCWIKFELQENEIQETCFFSENEPLWVKGSTPLKDLEELPAEKVQDWMNSVIASFIIFARNHPKIKVVQQPNEGNRSLLFYVEGNLAFFSLFLIALTDSMDRLEFVPDETFQPTSTASAVGGALLYAIPFVGTSKIVMEAYSAYQSSDYKGAAKHFCFSLISLMVDFMVVVDPLVPMAINGIRAVTTAPRTLRAIKSYQQISPTVKVLARSALSAAHYTVDRKQPPPQSTTLLSTVRRKNINVVDATDPELLKQVFPILAKDLPFFSD